MDQKRKRPVTRPAFLLFKPDLDQPPRSMTARRFLGSRTPGPVGTSGSWKLLPSIAMESAVRPSRTISSFTAVARRIESAWLYRSEPTVSVWPVTMMRTEPNVLAAETASVTVLCASAVRFDLSKSKKTIYVFAGGGGG